MPDWLLSSKIGKKCRNKKVISKVKKIIVSFGEILWDILPTCKVIGGAPFNFAFRVNSLGDRGFIISRLGRDKLGRKAFDSVSVLGLDTTYLQWDASYPTGTVQVSFDHDNRPDYLIVPRVAYDHIQATGDIREIASRADCICFGTLSQRSEKNRRTLQALLKSSGNCLKLLQQGYGCLFARKFPCGQNERRGGLSAGSNF